MKEQVKSVSSLLIICLAVALLLSAVNYLTSPIIEEAERQKTFAALLEVLPGGRNFEDVDLAPYTLPATVTEAYSEDGGGYVIKLKTAGYSANMILLCGISADGVVTGAVCISSEETLGYEKTYGASLVGRSEADIADVATVAGATKTTEGYRNAVRDALSAVKILKGGAGA